MNENIFYDIKLDLVHNTISNFVHVMQYDNNVAYIKANIFKNWQTINLTTEFTKAKLKFKKPTGEVVVFTTDDASPNIILHDTYVQINVVGALTDSFGKCPATIEFFKEESGVVSNIHTARFILDVDRNPNQTYESPVNMPENWETLMEGKQNKNDPNLQTVSKTIVGAINELAASSGISEIDTQDVRIWGLEPGLYKLTYNGDKKVYYSGESGTGYFTLQDTIPILFIKQTSSTIFTWMLFDNVVDSQTNKSIRIRYGNTTITSGNSYNFILPMSTGDSGTFLKSQGPNAEPVWEVCQTISEYIKKAELISDVELWLTTSDDEYIYFTPVNSISESEFDMMMK